MPGLQLHPHRLTARRQLASSDMQCRIQLAEWLKENPDVLDKLWFSDEAHFYLSGKALQNEVHWGKNVRKWY